MKKLFIILITLVLASCSKEEIKKEPLKIMVIGNSITYSPEFGEWKGNWGMASTSPEKDFCGIIGKNTNLDRKNIAVWENDFYCSQEYYTITTSLKYDYLILKIGENVTNLVNFKTELQKLTEYYSNYADKIILVTTVWKQYEFDSLGNPYEVPSDKDRIITEVALENNFILVDISEMKEDVSNYAWYEYEDSSIACHPNDKGMKFIADKILEKINLDN
jgi:hypothetical protein